MTRPLQIIALLCLFPAAAIAAEANGERYRQCLEMTDKDPASAYDAAALWVDQGGGTSARHCLALALVHIGQFRLGAEKLKDLAQTKIDMPKATRAELWVQSGEAQLLAKSPDSALKAFGEAAKILPEDPGLQLDLARAFALKPDWNAAIRACDAALKRDPKLGEALALRATARRETGKLAEAQADADLAIAIDENNASAWLERGRLAQAKGDKTAARRAFIRAALVDDKSPIAEDARYALEAMDVKVEK